MSGFWRFLFEGVNLTLFLYLIHRYLWHRVKGYLDRRVARMEEEQEEAELELEGVAAELEEARALLTQATSEAAEIVKSAREEGKRILEEIIHQAEEEAENILSSAERRIERMSLEARVELRTFFAEFVFRETERRLKGRLSPKEDRYLFSSFLNRMKEERDVLKAAS